MRKIELLLVFITIVVLTNPIFPWTQRITYSSDMIEGDKYLQLFKSGLFLITFLILIINWKIVKKIVLNEPYVFLIIIWAFCSTFWSEEPSMTIRRTIALLGATLVGLLFSIRLTHRKFLLIFGYAFLFLNIMSVFVSIFFPSWGIMNNGLGWQGIFNNKNALGNICFISVIFFLELIRTSRKPIIWICGILNSFFLLAMSKSMTSIAITVLIIFLWILFINLQRLDRKIFFPLFLIIALSFTLLFWFYQNSDIKFLFDLLGKDMTFTGRIYTWDFVIYMFLQSPIIGYGYGAIWLGSNFGLGSYIGRQINYFASNAHNGYLDVLLQLGYVGGAFSVLYLSRVIIKWFSQIFGKNLKKWPTWQIIFLTAIVIYNFFETDFLLNYRISWVILAYLAFVSPEYPQEIRENYS